MKRITLVTAACAAAVLRLNAEVVARVLVTKSSAVVLYTVDENDAWTPGQTLCTVPGGNFFFSAIHREGIVYASQATNADAPTGLIRMSDLSGNSLGNLPEVPTRCDGLVITPGGEYLFTSCGAGSATTCPTMGSVWRYSFAEGTWEQFATGLGSCLRNVEVDNDGHVYVATRTGNTIKVFDWNTSSENLPAAPVRTLTGTTFVSGLYLNTSDGYLYWSGRNGDYGRMKPDGTDATKVTGGDYSGWTYCVCFVNGKSYMGSVNVTQGAWRYDMANNFTQIFDFFTFGLSEVKVSPSQRWRLDEAANAAALDCDGSANRPVWPAGGARSGAAGVSGNALYFADTKSRAEISNSKDLVPATNDFAFAFWVGLPATNAATGGRHLLSNACGQDGALSVLADPDVDHLNKLALVFTPVSGGSDVTLSTDAVIADGAWHHVAVVRRGGTALELWLDGARTGVVAVAGTDAVARDWNWRIGSSGEEGRGFIGAGAFMDELSFFDDVPLSGEIPALADAFAPGAAPSAPAAPPAGADAMPAAYGTEIAHATSTDAPLANPHLFVAADGAYWVAAGRANGPAADDQTTMFWRSADKGATWTPAGTLAAGGASLFESGGALCAMGMKTGTGVYLDGCRTCAVWVREGEAWTEKASYTADRTMFMAPGPVAISNGRIGKPVSCFFTPFTGNAEAGYVSFTANGTTFGGSHLLSIGSAFIECWDYKLLSTIADLLPGCAVPMPDGSVTALYPVADGVSSVDRAVRGLERAYGSLLTHNTVDVGRGLSVHRMFRGGAKPFDVKYDAASGLYWALSVPATNRYEAAARTTDTIRNVLALYVSNDLVEWRPCGNVAVSGDVGSTGFNGPSFAFDGDDLVVACGVACADGVCGARSTAHNTYLAFRRITDFRTAYTPATPGGERMLVTDLQRSSVQAYWRDADGEWYPDSFFMDYRLSYGGAQYANPMQIKACRDRVYLAFANYSPMKILEFDNLGGYRRTLTAPEGVGGYTVAIAVDANCETLYAYAENSNAVFRVNLSSGTWTEIIRGGDAGPLNKPFHMAVGADGSLYAANYALVGGTYDVNRFNGGGVWQEKILGLNQNLTGLAIDDKNGRLFCAHVRGNVYRVDLTTLESTRICDRFLQRVSPSFELCLVDGRLYATATYGWLYSLDPLTGAEEVPFASQFTSYGITTVNREYRRGFMFSIR